MTGVHKTPEQWFKENPEAVGKKWANPGESLRTDQIQGGTRYWDSDYIYAETFIDHKYAHGIKRFEKRLIDSRTGELLARTVDFERGGANPALSTDSITDYKFWLGMGANICRTNGVSCRRRFGEVAIKFKEIGRGAK